MQMFHTVISDMKNFGHVLKKGFDLWLHGTMWRRFVGLVGAMVMVLVYLGFVDYSINNVVNISNKIVKEKNEEKHAVKKSRIAPVPNVNNKSKDKNNGDSKGKSADSKDKSKDKVNSKSKLNDKSKGSGKSKGKANSKNETKNKPKGKVKDNPKGKSKVKTKDKYNNAFARKDPDYVWKHPTGGRYPDITHLNVADVHVKVDTKKQRVYIYHGKKVIYEMLASTGVKGSETPKGDFLIGTRTEHFYNAYDGGGMGGDYAVSFKDDVYLFHSVPTRENFGDYIEEEGRKLGHKASHGCIRLSVPDARWFFDNIKPGTHVKII